MSYVPQVEIDNDDSTETIKLPSIQHLLSEKIDLCNLDQLLLVVDEISNLGSSQHLVLEMQVFLLRFQLNKA